MSFAESFIGVTMILGTFLYVFLAKKSGRNKLVWGLIGGGISYLVCIPFSIILGLIYAWIHDTSGRVPSPLTEAFVYLATLALAITLVWLLGRFFVSRPLKSKIEQSSNGQKEERAR